MNELVPAQQRTRALAVDDVVDIMDTNRFEQMGRIANVMAMSSLIPESLAGFYEGTGNNRVFKPFPIETVKANCFLIVNQSVRWGLDPFAVAQATSIVRGKLCYEGKLVAGVISAKLGIDLDYDFNDKTGDALGVTVSGIVGGKTKTVGGTVGEWKTTGSNSPWGNGHESNKRMLRYRGTREWARAYTPALMLGVYTQDEMLDAAERARDVTPPTPPETIAALPQRQQQPAETRTDAPYAEMQREEPATTGKSPEVHSEDPPPPPATEDKNPPAPPSGTDAPEGDAPNSPPPASSDDGRDYEGLLADLEDEMAYPDSKTTLDVIRDRVKGQWLDAAPDEIFERAKAIYQRNVERVKGGKKTTAPPPATEEKAPPPPVAETKPVEPKADDLEAWFQKGREAFDDGMAFNKYPPSLKSEAMIDAKQSWLDGWSAQKREKAKK